MARLAAHLTGRLAEAAVRALPRYSLKNEIPCPGPRPAGETGPVADAIAFAGASEIRYGARPDTARDPARVDPVTPRSELPGRARLCLRYAHSCAVSTQRQSP